MTNHYTFVEIERQDQLTRPIQERLASVGEKNDCEAPRQGQPASGGHDPQYPTRRVGGKDISQLATASVQ